ncbi:MAG: hypothetical protein WA584_12490 [Pyrinomonadaceae bacterium]
MFKFLSKNSVDEAISCAYLATKMIEFKGKIDIGEEDKKIENLAEKMIAEIEEAEETTLENFSEETTGRYTRIVSEWTDALIFTRELSLSDLKKGEETVASWLASEAPGKAAETVMPMVGNMSYVPLDLGRGHAYAYYPTALGDERVEVVPERFAGGGLPQSSEIVPVHTGRTFYMHHLRHLAESEDESFQKRMEREMRNMLLASKKSTGPDK